MVVQLDDEEAELDLPLLQPETLAQVIQRAQRDEAARKSRRSVRKGRGPVASTSKAARQASAASFYVPRLPGQTPELQLAPMYSGHLPASYSTAEDIDPATLENDAHLFFLLVKAKHIADKAKLVIWFNGGPGCSSFDGALLEIGPAMVQGVGKEATLVDNPGKWNEYANVLFIDQPAGTGYSYINKGLPVSELAPAADQIVTFMENFYTVFPEYSKMDTYIAGESYAGTTIPYLAKAITSKTTLPTRLKGLLIGNGWFSPAQQYPAYVAYGKANGLVKQKDEKIDNMMKRCDTALAGIEGKGHVLVGVCENLIGAVIDAGKANIDTSKECINAYDTRPSSFCGEYPAGLKYATPYLGDKSVVNAFHASNKHEKWVQCNNTVGAQMWSPKSTPSVNLLPELLETMPMLFFAGEADLMCAWNGIEDTIQAMTWKDETGFGNATAQEWSVNGTVAGTWRTARNMTFVKVAQAGHMVPIDQPYAAHDILLRFIGIDPLLAAGDASRVPSRIGQASAAKEAVIGKVAPDGGTLTGVIEQHEKEAAAAASSAAAAVDNYEEAGQPIDKERELLYGPRRTAVLVCIVFAAIVAVYALLRWRAAQRRARGWTPKRGPYPNGKGKNTPSTGGYRFSRLSGSSFDSARHYQHRQDMRLPSSTVLKRIEEHELQHGQTEDARLQDVAKSVFTLDDEESFPESSSRSGY